jgi:hypothetical protein
MESGLKMRTFFDSIFGGMATIAMIAVWILIGVGDIYWLWMAIHLGSFGMFLIGLFPPTAAIIGMPVGAWSLLFGAPDWVISFFG